MEARPDSLAYVTGRFVRRHRATVLAATVAVLALLGGLGTALVTLCIGGGQGIATVIERV